MYMYIYIYICRETNLFLSLSDIVKKGARHSRVCDVPLRLVTLDTYMYIYIYLYTYIHI